MDAAKRLGRLFDKTILSERVEDAADHIFAKFAVGVLAPAELERELDLAAILKKTTNLLDLVVEVVRVRAGVEFHFLHLLDLLRLSLLASP